MFPTKTVTMEEENRFGGPASSMSKKIRVIVG